MTDRADDYDLNAMSDKRTLSDADKGMPERTETRGQIGNLGPIIVEYIRAAHSENTRRAYAADLRHFVRWGGGIPSSPQEIAEYLAVQASVFSTRTLRRRLAALAYAHAETGSDPTKSELISRLVRGIARRHERPPLQATPLLLADLEQVCRRMDERGESVARDRAILLLGFFAALRRSEIGALDWGDIQGWQSGLLLTIRRSKTDQIGKGRRVFISQRTDLLCPIHALQVWAANTATDGPVFCSQPGRRLADRTISRIVQRWTLRAELDGRFSGHSLRAGYATSAALTGADSTLIARQTGHKSIQALSAYVRAVPGGSSPVVLAERPPASAMITIRRQ